MAKNRQSKTADIHHRPFHTFARRVHPPPSSPRRETARRCPHRPALAPNPQFNRDTLPAALRQARIFYTHLGQSAACAIRARIRPTPAGATPASAATPTTCRHPSSRRRWESSWNLPRKNGSPSCVPKPSRGVAIAPSSPSPHRPWRPGRTHHRSDPPPTAHAHAVRQSRRRPHHLSDRQQPNDPRPENAVNSPPRELEVAMNRKVFLDHEVFVASLAALVDEKWMG